MNSDQEVVNTELSLSRAAQHHARALAVRIRRQAFVVQDLGLRGLVEDRGESLTSVDQAGQDLKQSVTFLPSIRIPIVVILLQSVEGGL